MASFNTRCRLCDNLSRCQVKKPFSVAYFHLCCLVLTLPISQSHIGSYLWQIGEVTPHPARLVLGWCLNRYVTSHPRRLSLAIPP